MIININGSVVAIILCNYIYFEYKMYAIRNCLHCSLGSGIKHIMYVNGLGLVITAPQSQINRTQTIQSCTSEEHQRRQALQQQVYSYYERMRI